MLDNDIEADYYAFSDQDDVWDPDKISRAVNFLEKEEDTVKLYASSLRRVDNSLNELGFKDISSLPSNLDAIFTCMRLAGVHLFFQNDLNKLLKNTVILK